jgi:hypothetical protein
MEKPIPSVWYRESFFPLMINDQADCVVNSPIFLFIRKMHRRRGDYDLKLKCDPVCFVCTFSLRQL